MCVLFATGELSEPFTVANQDAFCGWGEQHSGYPDRLVSRDDYPPYGDHQLQPRSNKTKIKTGYGYAEQP